MPRLKAIPYRLARLPSKVGLAPPLPPSKTADHRSWYDSARWKRLRLDTFKRDLFTCAMCGRIQPDTSQLVCDHIRPHRGSPKLFWDRLNLQTLCPSPCHSSKKQREEAKQPGNVGTWY